MEINQLQDLTVQLQNGTDRERKAASYKLGRSRDPEAVPVLINAFNDPDPTVHQNILDGLRAIGTREALDFLATHDLADKAADNVPPQTTVPVASSMRRFWNLFIDTLIYEIIAFFVATPVAYMVLGRQPMENFWISLLYGMAVLFLYYFIFEMAFQKTPAKFITGTRVARLDGSRPDAITIAKRSLCRFVPFETISMYTGKDPNQKGTWWHDRWTGTRVIRG